MDAAQSKRRARRGASSQRSRRPSKPTGRDFTHLALWMAGSLAGVVTAALLAQGPFFRALSRRVGWAGRAARAIGRGSPCTGRGRRSRPTREEALPMLAEAVVGNSKCAVASVFGPPRGAILAGPLNPYSNYWQADTWYYPLPKSGPLAMVIAFHEDFASRVEFLSPPNHI